MLLLRSDASQPSPQVQPCFVRQPHKVRYSWGLATALAVAPILGGCAVHTASMTSEFTVVSDHIAVPVHVSGAALGATTADLGGMVKQATECGLKHASPSTTSALEGRNLRMVWAVNGLIKPGLSSVSLRTEADGLPNHVDVERISLQASPQPTFVREMCEMASGSLAAMRDTANPRSVSNN